MADSKITALTELTTPASADLLAIVDDVAVTPTTKKVEIDSLDDYFSASTKTLTNKTLTSPTINNATISQGSMDSDGSAKFALDAGGDDKFSIANDATATPFGGTNNFSGFFLIHELNSGHWAFVISSGNYISIVAQASTTFSTTANTSSKTNIYISSSVVTVQNKLGSSKSYRCVAFRTRLTN